LTFSNVKDKTVMYKTSVPTLVLTHYPFLRFVERASQYINFQLINS